VLDSLDAFVYSKDLDGNYTYANKAVRELFGASLADIVGKDDSQFFDLEQSNVLKLNDAEVMSTGATVSREERDVVAETGEERVFWTVKSPIRDASGSIVGMCGISLETAR
jgi:PAS domain S-box-containing protein